MLIAAYINTIKIIILTRIIYHYLYLINKTFVRISNMYYIGELENK